MRTDQLVKDEFEKYGRVWLRDAISDADLSLFDKAATDTTKAGQRLEASTALDAALSKDSSLLDATRRLDPQAEPVRTVAFNKSQNANWGVPWHQDRVIAVAAKEDVTGYRNWTKKTGIWHCEPPETVLKSMLFVRVHLDDTNEANGAMEIAVGSHAGGIISSTQAAQASNSYPIEVCEAKRGDVLILKMLTLHSSKPARAQTGRRVVRVDFSSLMLPLPLLWGMQIAETRR